MPERSPIIVALGELLWDVYPDEARFGGAPGNFAHHAAAMGAATFMVSRVGDDELGRRAIERLQRSKIDVTHVAIDRSHPTGSVDVTVDDQGRATYQFHQNEAWDHLQWSDDLSALASRVDVVCFGSLGQRSESSGQTIRRFVAATPESAWRIFDVNLRPPFYTNDVVEESIKIANVLKLNEDELEYMVRKFGIVSQSKRKLTASEQVSAIRQKFALKVVAVTRGPRGAIVVDKQSVCEIPGEPTNVSDTVGAGDSFTATLAVGLYSGVKLESVAAAACRIAEFVCTQSGATPDLPKSLIRA